MLFLRSHHSPPLHCHLHHAWRGRLRLVRKRKQRTAILGGYVSNLSRSLQSIETGGDTQCSGAKFKGGGESHRSDEREAAVVVVVKWAGSSPSAAVFGTSVRPEVGRWNVQLPGFFNHASLFSCSLPRFVRSAACVGAFRRRFGGTIRVGRDTHIGLRLSSTASRPGSCACVPSSAEVCLRFGPHRCQRSADSIRLLSGTLSGMTAWHTAAFCTEICHPYSDI